MTLIKPQDVTLTDRDGEEVTFVLSRLPATLSREIAAKYPVANLPKLGEYDVSEQAMLLLMKHVAVRRPDGQELVLSTRALVDNHVPDGETLLKLEAAMLQYNFSFFGQGGLSGWVESILTRLLPSITQTLTECLRQSSRRVSQPGPSSNQP